MHEIDLLAEMVARIEAASPRDAMQGIDEAVETLRTRVSATVAADIIGVSKRSVLHHAQRALEGKPSRLQDVRRDERGRVTVPVEEVLALRVGWWRRGGGPL